MMNRNLLTIAFALIFVVQLAFAGMDDTAEESSSAQESGDVEGEEGDMSADDYLVPGAALKGEVSGHGFDPEVEVALDAAEDGEIEEVDAEEAGKYESEEHGDRHALIGALTAHAVNTGRTSNPTAYKASLRRHKTSRLLKKAKNRMSGFKLSIARKVHDEQQALEGHGGIAKVGNEDHVVTPAFVKGLKAADREKLLKHFEITPTNMKKYEALAVDRDLVRAHFGAKLNDKETNAVSKMSEGAIEKKIRQLIQHHGLTGDESKKRLIFDLRHTRGLLKTENDHNRKDTSKPQHNVDKMSHKEMKAAVHKMKATVHPHKPGTNMKEAHAATNKQRIKDTHTGINPKAAGHGGGGRDPDDGKAM